MSMLFCENLKISEIDEIYLLNKFKFVRFDTLNINILTF